MPERPATRRLNELPAEIEQGRAPSRSSPRPTTARVARGAARTQIEDALKARPAARRSWPPARSSSASTWARSTWSSRSSRRGAVARGLQRVGRAGHQVGEAGQRPAVPQAPRRPARGRGRGRAHARAARSSRCACRATRSTCWPSRSWPWSRCDAWPVDALSRLVRRAAPASRELPRRRRSTGVLDLLAGRYPVARRSPSCARASCGTASTDVLTPRRGAQRPRADHQRRHHPRPRHSSACSCGDGTAAGGRARRGDGLRDRAPARPSLLGARTWRIEDITRDRVLVSPRAGRAGQAAVLARRRPRPPARAGPRPSARSSRELAAMRPSPRAAAPGRAHRPRRAARPATSLRLPRRAARGRPARCPTTAPIVVERFRDELGDWRVCVLSPFGARVHAPVGAGARGPARPSGSASTVQAHVERRRHRAAPARGADELPARAERRSCPIPTRSRSWWSAQLATVGPVRRRRFRECAARALLLPRRPARPAHAAVAAAAQAAATCCAVAAKYPSFPIVPGDLPRVPAGRVRPAGAASSCCGACAARAVRVVDWWRPQAPSPFAQLAACSAASAAYMYEGDAPLAERRAQALSLDRAAPARAARARGAARAARRRGARRARGRAAAPGRRAPGARRRRPARSPAPRRRSERDRGRGRASPQAARPPPRPGRALDALVRTRRAVRCASAASRAGSRSRTWPCIATRSAPRRRRACPRCSSAPGAAPVEAWSAALAAHGPFAGRGGRALRAARGPGGDPARRPWPRGQAGAGRVPARGAWARVVRPGGPAPDRSGVPWRSCATRSRPVESRGAGALLARVARHRRGAGAADAGSRRCSAQLEGVPLSFQELESAILPGRVPDSRPAHARRARRRRAGWCGWATARWAAATAGSRCTAATAWPRCCVPPEPPAELGGCSTRHSPDHLAGRGASFFVALLAACSAAQRRVLEALGDLAWAGLITNDTFQPLRLLGRSAGGGAGRRQAREMPWLRRAAGRWCASSWPVRPAPPSAAAPRAAARAPRRRSGERSRPSSPAGRVFGRVSGLRAMEEAGKVRRGYFVEGPGRRAVRVPGRGRPLREDAPAR